MKNIIFITGTDSYGVEREVTRWVRAFGQKVWEINIDRYDLGEKDQEKWLSDILLMSGLFAEKRLFIFRGGRTKKSKNPGIESILEKIYTSLPEEHFLLFHDISDKEDGLKKWLQKHADTREIDTLWDARAWGERFEIDTGYLASILQIYRENESGRERDETSLYLGHSIAHSIELVSLLSASGKKLDKTDIQALCHGFGGDTLFSLVDAIMSGNIQGALTRLQRISDTRRVDEWLASLIGLIRNHAYILTLKSFGKKETEIASLIPIHPYVLKKAYQARIPSERLNRFYTKLISSNVAYKRGKWLKDNELWRILSVELALLDLQKV